ncbi:hypothetical protein SADUNF_Sadunf06G0027900 [Salix dunnii]|uniref:Uncharacterized protein n=1 Tax=Salix dunnii TaxID=1413687 RepID=A0A835MWL0_9ROSI|nr:hypothetical protein SADUNF_Sadunf06G0027900 [Salix dunnii]
MAEMQLNEIRVDPWTNRQEDPVSNGSEQGSTMAMTEIQGASSQTNECSSWLSGIMGVEESKSKRQIGPMIPKVRDKLKGENKGSYEPSVVSIGPYHYTDRQDKLLEVEKLKVQMARQFVHDSKKDIEILYSGVAKVAENAKGFYEKCSIRCFDDEQFTRMMFLDGCFILQFINGVMRKNLDMYDWQIIHVKQDLLLLENQLPFPVLKALMSMSRDGNDQGMKIIGDFLSLHTLQQSDHRRPVWVLTWLVRGSQKAIHKQSRRSCCVYRLCECLRVFFPKPKSGSYGHNLYYSAKDLQKVGIHFKPSKTNTLMDVEFQPSIFYGTLKLPAITIESATESMLLNLVAYETAAFLDEPWVISYICFIDSLIDDAEDVKVLRSKGILTNYLGPDRKVADLFNNIGRSLEPNTNVYNGVKREINIACESIWKKWIAEWQQTYFSSPWAFIAFVAASAGLVLTATQTYYTVYPI